jgi:hypothetical protein
MMETEVSVRAPVVEGMRTLTREELRQHEAAITAMAVEESIDETAQPVSIKHRGRTLVAYPLDVRRFIRCMAAHVSMN